MTEEERERLKRIRERRSRNTGPSFGYVDGLCEDIDFLLSLLDSQAASPLRPTGWQAAQVTFDNPRAVKIVFETPACAEAFIDGLEPAIGPIVAATAMRDACVVHLQTTADALDVRQETECPSGTAFTSEAALRRRIAGELQSLTLDQVEQKKHG